MKNRQALEIYTVDPVDEEDDAQVLVRLRISSLATSSTEMSFSIGMHESSPPTLSGLRPVHCCEVVADFGGLRAFASLDRASFARRSFNFNENIATLRALFNRLLLTRLFFAASSSAAVKVDDVDAEATLVSGTLGEDAFRAGSMWVRTKSKVDRAGSTFVLTGSKDALGTIFETSPLLIFSKVLAGALGRRTSCEPESPPLEPPPLSGLKRNFERGCIQGGAERSKSESDEAASSFATMQSVLWRMEEVPPSSLDSLLARLSPDWPPLAVACLKRLAQSIPPCGPMVRWWLRICELSGGNGSRRLSASHSRDLVIGERGDDLSERSCSDSLELVWPRPGEGVSGGSCTGLLSPKICIEERDWEMEGANRDAANVDGGVATFSDEGVPDLGDGVSAWGGVWLHKLFFHVIFITCRRHHKSRD